MHRPRLFQVPVEHVPVGERTFISCSTGDIEFRALLVDLERELKAEGEGVCPTLVAESGNAGRRVRFPRSGFPVNFDNGPESVPDSEIQLTRGLLFGAMIQAIDVLLEGASAEPAGLMLAPELQKFVVRTWHASSGAPRESDHEFDDTAWIAAQSAGESILQRKLNAMFERD